jgi:predicted nucleic acid-binding protein
VPDVAVPEVMNAFHVQEHVLHLIEDGASYIDAFFDVVESDQIRVTALSRELVTEAYRVAARYRGAAYDCIFVALALKLDLRLVTRDQKQAKIMEAEISRRGSRKELGGEAG